MTRRQQQQQEEGLRQGIVGSIPEDFSTHAAEDDGRRLLALLQGSGGPTAAAAQQQQQQAPPGIRVTLPMPPTGLPLHPHLNQQQGPGDGSAGFFPPRDNSMSMHQGQGQGGFVGGAFPGAGLHSLSLNSKAGDPTQQQLPHSHMGGGGGFGIPPGLNQVPPPMHFLTPQQQGGFAGGPVAPPVNMGMNKGGSKGGQGGSQQEQDWGSADQFMQQQQQRQQGSNLLFGGSSTWSMSSQESNQGLGSLWNKPTANPGAPPGRTRVNHHNQSNHQDPRMPGQDPFLFRQSYSSGASSSDHIQSNRGGGGYPLGNNQQQQPNQFGGGGQVGVIQQQQNSSSNHNHHTNMRRGSSSSGGATGLGFDELLRRDHGRGQQRDSNSRPRQQQQQMIMEPKTNYNNKHELRRGSQDGSHNRNRSNSRQKRMKNPRWRTDVLDRQLREIYMKLLPSKEEIWMKKKCFNKIQKILNKKFKDSALRMFGSSANNLGICKNHDIDLSLEIDISTNDSENENENSSSDSENSNSNSNEDDQVQVRLTQQYVVKTMAKLLRRNRMAKVMPIPKARVPIVKFTEPQTGIECDICVNNLLAVENTVMLRKYSEIDPRLKELVILVKHWSKRRGVNGAFRGTLSSYAYVIMCIHLLQTVQPAILPCLQSSHYQPTINKVVDSWECKYCGDLSHFRNFGALNKSTSAELLYQFFYYWAYQHNYKASVISMRVGDWFSKEDKGWTTRKAGDNHLICIEDPFQLSNDLGRVVSRRTIFFLRDEFKRAADIMGNASDPIRAGLFDILGEAEKEQKLKMHEDSVRSRSKSQ